MWKQLQFIPRIFPSIHYGNYQKLSEQEMIDCLYNMRLSIYNGYKRGHYCDVFNLARQNGIA